MSWMRLDDKIATHRKTVAAGNKAFGAWVRMGCHSLSHGTDGRITRAEALLYGTPADVARLVKVGFLDPVEGDSNSFQVHDLLEWNFSSVSVKAFKGERSESGRRGGLKRAENARLAKLASSKQLEETQADSSSFPFPLKDLKNLTPKPPLKLVEAGELAELETTGVAVDELGEHPIQTSEQKYQAAYCAGIVRGKRSPFVFPQSLHAAGDLNSVLPAHALSADGKKLRGAPLLAWIEDNAAAFAEHALESGPEFFSSYAPKGFMRWCNLGRPGFVAKLSPDELAERRKPRLMAGITQADLDAATAAVAAAVPGSQLAERRSMLGSILDRAPEVEPRKANES